MDNFSGLRRTLHMIAQEQKEWSGIPMPIEGERLVIEPTYPRGKELSEIGRQQDTDQNAIPKKDIINSWYSMRETGWVYVCRENGRSRAYVNRQIHHFDMDLHSIGCSYAWGIEQESNAVHLLGTLVRHHIFKQYLLTGMLLESSPRSGITYVFRRLKPTVAMSFRNDKSKILACLCMHPIGHYAETWAGAMCPTDDVIAHLMLMRGDEHMFWKRCNQIPAWSPLAGL